MRTTVFEGPGGGKAGCGRGLEVCGFAVVLKVEPFILDLQPDSRCYCDLTSFGGGAGYGDSTTIFDGPGGGVGWGRGLVV